MKTVMDLFQVGMSRHVPSFLPIEGTFKLNLGAGNKQIAGFTDLDYPEWDADEDAIPCADESVDAIVAFHFLEHCKYPVKVLQECQRVLKVGGTLNIVVPYYTSQMQAHDLDHKHKFCEETWKILFSNPYYDKNKIKWEFKVRTNLIIGLVERNLALLTQLVKG